MKISKMNASFGKLQNETLKLHDGLNIINAPNESGKSTWCAFIRAMLYGIDSSERARNGYIPEKQRYVPWSGAPMEGSMDLTVNDCKISITRTTRAKNAPMREFKAVYTGTNTEVEELSGQNAGEQLTGVSRDVFSRSAFIPQGEVAVTGSPELEKRINTIVSSGEECSSYTEADARLRSWQRRRRWNQKGLLPELEARMDESEKKLHDMSSSADVLEGMEAELSEVHDKCTELEGAVTESRKMQRKDSLSRLSSGRSQLQQKSRQHDADMAELSQRRGEYRATRFGDRTIKQLEDEVNRDVDTLSALSVRPKTMHIVLPALLCFILAIVFAAVYARHSAVVLIVFAALFCAAAVILLLRYSKIRQKISEDDEQQRQIYKKYRVSDTDGIYAVLERQSELWNAAAEAQRAELISRDEYEQARDEQAELEEQALSDLDFSDGNSDAARLSRELNTARKEAQSISARISELSGRISATGDPLVIASGLSCMREKYEVIEEEYNAIELASQVLSEADREMQSRFSPEIGRLAAKYMSSVTGGKYEDVLINRDFSARTKADGDTVARDAEYLSAGTLDLMYLAVRLAVCELALPKGEPCPLIIDDALVNLDGQRYDEALSLLGQIAKKRQVILFTCRD